VTLEGRARLLVYGPPQMSTSKVMRAKVLGPRKPPLTADIDRLSVHCVYEISGTAFSPDPKPFPGAVEMFRLPRFPPPPPHSCPFAPAPGLCRPIFFLQYRPSQPELRNSAVGEPLSRCLLSGPSRVSRVVFSTLRPPVQAVHGVRASRPAHCNFVRCPRFLI